jgi:hypothetical protein
MSTTASMMMSARKTPIAIAPMTHIPENPAVAVLTLLMTSESDVEASIFYSKKSRKIDEK